MTDKRRPYVIDALATGTGSPSRLNPPTTFWEREAFQTIKELEADIEGLRALAQRTAALATANKVRLARVQVKRQIHSGAMSVSEAIEDPCCASAEIRQLLEAQKGVGPSKAKGFLSRLAWTHGTTISPNRKVYRLTDREKAVLREAVG